MHELSPCRSEILTALAVGEWTGSDLAVVLNRLPTNISRDLRIMRKAGLVESRRDGAGVFWRAVKRGAR